MSKGKQRQSLAITEAARAAGRQLATTGPLENYMRKLTDNQPEELPGTFTGVIVRRGKITDVVENVLSAGGEFGNSADLAGKNINLEFVSANPTGPIHIGGTRWAAVGDALGRLLSTQGAHVVREYYFNDHGTQIDRFANSLIAAAKGERTPDDGYAGDYIKELAASNRNHTTDLFAHQAAAGTLPAVSWLYAEGRPSLSEHPRQNVTLGAQWTAAQLKAIVDGQLWGRTVVFITWDDWGGWFDHVTPPNVEQWTSAGKRPKDAFPGFDGQQFRYGSRVPCLVVSPYAKRGYVSKTQRSHISLVKFCQTLFGLQTINSRLDTADDMLDCFDPTQKPLPPPVI